MIARRRICVLTGSRADYGLLRSLLRAVADDAELALQIVATGTHLSPEFGMTVGEIEADGFRIDARVDMLLSADSPVATAKSMGLGTLGFADALARLAPDILVLPGDRFEILAAASAALVLRIPIAHLHGGELSEGAYDDSIRHAVTKLSQWHFVAAAPYRERVVQMGESPDRVFEVGAPGLDQLADMEWLDRGALADSLGLALGRPLLLVTHHPATLDQGEVTRSLDALLGALETVPEATIVFTYPNADCGGRAMRARLERFVEAAPDRRRLVASLGRQRYLSLLREADVVVGNSSSGLIEAPAVRTATVNVGERQRGRLRAGSVIDAPDNGGAIAAAIRRALSDDFRRTLAHVANPYGRGEAGRRMRDLLKAVPLSVVKRFHDIPAVAATEA